jgi:RNA polymerase sigma-70 factor (ECF subfamily)
MGAYVATTARPAPSSSPSATKRRARGDGFREHERGLLARVAQHDAEAVRLLFDQYASRARSAAWRVLRDRDEVEDVVQETFIELWQGSADFDVHRGSAASWVMTIARNRAIDRLRARVRASRALDAAAVDLQPVAIPTPDELEDQRRDRDALHRALDALNPNQRAAIGLAYFQRLSQVQVAERTGKPLGTVKLQRRTALATLARLYRAARRAPRSGWPLARTPGDYRAPKG